MQLLHTCFRRNLYFVVVVVYLKIHFFLALEKKRDVWFICIAQKFGFIFANPCEIEYKRIQ